MFANAIRSIWTALTTPLELGGTVLPFGVLRLILEFVLPLAAFYVVARLIRFFVRKRLDTAEIKPETQKRVLAWIKAGYRTIFVLLLFLLSGMLFGARMFDYLGGFVGVLNEPFFESGGTQISIITLLMTLPIFYLASWAGSMSRKFLESNLLDRITMDQSRRFSLANLMRYAIMAIVTLVGLSIIGIDLSSLAVIFGVLGIGIGFGLQSTIANFFAGLIIIVSRPIKEGDRIQVEGMEGTVTHIRLINSIINTITNETIVVPNSQMVQNPVHNYSYEDRRIILVNTVQVSYASDLENVARIMEGIPLNSPYSVPSSQIDVFVRSFDDSGITMMLRSWIREAEDRHRASSWVNMEIWKRFKEEGIEIPFPQRDLHLRSVTEGQKLIRPE